MGRITAYDQNGHMIADFDKSEYDLMRVQRKYMSNADLIALIESLLHCIHDMDRGIGCNGCKSNIGGGCIIRHRIEEYDVWKSNIMIGD